MEESLADVLEVMAKSQRRIYANLGIEITPEEANEQLRALLLEALADSIKKGYFEAFERMRKEAEGNK